MSQTEISASTNQVVLPQAANEEVFSLEANEAAMRVVRIAEARNDFDKANRSAHSLRALFQELLGKVGIELSGSATENAAFLVNARALAAANDEPSRENKTGTKG